MRIYWDLLKATPPGPSQNERRQTLLPSPDDPRSDLRHRGPGLGDCGDPYDHNPKRTGDSMNTFQSRFQMTLREALAIQERQLEFYEPRFPQLRPAAAAA